MIAQGIPGQFAEHEIVLMKVVAAMGENHIRQNVQLQLLENILDLCAALWEVTILEFVDNYLFLPDILQEFLRTFAGLLTSFAESAAYHPCHLDVGILADQS